MNMLAHVFFQKNGIEGLGKTHRAQGKQETLNHKFIIQIKLDNGGWRSMELNHSCCSESDS